MKRIIYRVDDRFIHGQVIEGWINYYGIPNIILVNDSIAGDPCQRVIYESVIPMGRRLFIMTVSDFIKKKPYKKYKKGGILIIVGSVRDMYSIRKLPDDDSYINVGCIATGGRAIKVTDTVYLDKEQLYMLKEMSLMHEVFVHKLPWDTPIDIKIFQSDLSEDET